MATDIGSDVKPDKISLRPVIGLTEGLSKGDLEQITIEAIRTHRRLRDAADTRCEEWRQTLSTEALDTVGPARIAYVVAMIEMHAQQAALSTLLDLLGHVPSVPAD
ncbi:hypothetical protein AU467_30495 [Mesorhizobium loti]|uniref:Uncharacterized protein n=1 Tax=Rhizobium loti TaxID=381 RepID=A0A101KP83_RHILI|nr:hypothetical protein AU467_30495 [Mesorhizobium loti]